MALTDGNMVMPVAPSGGGDFGGNGWWILLLLLFAGGGFGGFGGNGMNGIYPWMNQADITTNGFQNQFMNENVTSIRDSLSGLATQLCSGFNGIEQGANARQMADMQTAFNAQTAMMQGFNGVQNQLSQCCCDNRMATVQTQNIVQSEGAATRLAIQNQTQQILDKMCQQEIDALKAQNASLQNQILVQTLNASQNAQSQYLVDRLAPAALIA
jgi:hypothetical protein